MKYSRHDLDIKEIQEHIKHGKLPTSLAMTWNGRVSFTLTDQMQLKKVTMLDVVIEENPSEDQYFDGDITILTTELSALIPDLLEALDGEVVKEHDGGGMPAGAGATFDADTSGTSGSPASDDFITSGVAEGLDADGEGNATDHAESTDDIGSDGIAFTSDNFGEGVTTSTGLSGHLPANPDDSFGGDVEYSGEQTAAMV